MLMRSMVAASTAATAHATARSRMRSASTSRRSGVEQFAVVQAAHGAVRGKHDRRRDHGTEQSAPRPTSSTPATHRETARAQFALERSLAAEFATGFRGPHRRMTAYSRSRRRAALPLRPRR